MKSQKSTLLEHLVSLLQTRNVFLTGGAGVGKSHLVRQLIEFYGTKSTSLVVLGSTAISAINIGGMTIHRFFGFGICDSLATLRDYDMRQATRLRHLRKLVSACKVLIIDEISMVNANLLEMIAFRLDDMGFTGRLLFVGDFYQLPPVQMASGYAFASAAWQRFAPFCLELTHSKRTKDKKLFKVLYKVRLGLVDDEVREFLASLISFDTPNDATVLFGRNDTAERLNLQRLSELEGEIRSYEAFLKIYDKNLDERSIKSWLQALRMPNLLHLKVGAKVMFVVNKIGEFYNGEQGVVAGFDGEKVLVVKSNGREIAVEPYKSELCEYKVIDNQVVSITRATLTQFPLRLAYAITIHKSQGMSIERLVCDLNNIFENGQAYVALSRAVSAKGLFVKFNGSFGNFWDENLAKINENSRNFKENFGEFIDKVSLNNTENLSNNFDMTSKKKVNFSKKSNENLAKNESENLPLMLKEKDEKLEKERLEMQKKVRLEFKQKLPFIITANEAVADFYKKCERVFEDELL